MKHPDFLSPGALVAIVATARWVEKKDLKYAEELLLQWGFKVVFGQSIGAKHHQLAGDDHSRAQDLQWALDHPEIKAIWCAKGGYGTIRILDKLSFDEFFLHPKWIVGYSDITALHAELHRLGWASIHGQMPLALRQKSEETALTIRRALCGETYAIRWPILEPSEDFSIEAPIVGGNLSLIYSLLGSESSFHGSSAASTQGKILFIEDLDEYLYHIDRMMHSLKRSGMLRGLKALVVGGMTQMKDHDIPFGYDPKAIILAAVAGQSYPVIFDAPVGHQKDNRALPFGLPCRLTLKSGQAKMEFYGPAQ